MNLVAATVIIAGLTRQAEATPFFERLWGEQKRRHFSTTISRT
jgi:hypothetical protein